MTIRAAAHRLFVIGSCVVLTVTGCAFHGLNSLPLPGAVGRGPGAQIFHVEIANVGSMEANSPVMVNDVVVGSISKMTVRGWHADVEVAVRPDVVVPANAVAKVGQTSLLGSMHLELNPPLGEQGTGRLQPGATIPLSKSSSYPSTEQTLSSISVIVNAGGLGQISDIIHNFSGALSGRENQVRDLLNRLDTFVGEFDDQRDNIVASIQGLNRVSATFASQRDVITRALREISPGLEVLLKERPRITTALDKLRVFSDTATRLINDTQTDLVKNLQNLEPTFCSLAEVGPDLDRNLAFAGSAFPYGQSLIDRGVRGDYFNVFVVIDITRARLKNQTFIGTHWQQKDLSLVPAPGDPGYDAYYAKNPNGDGYTGLPRTPPPPDMCANLGGGNGGH
ncbi:mammalian cell entry protein [Mycobacterium avium subsp. hominissuis]|uniref:MCE family protein n=1 Tax=Mycobacterium avium TaxID=1764 RepID=UPI0003925772|nr:MCE family protein [Mycobacterium avium]ATO66117.2 MCE family protein [Mycobacterium avium subsp. hominissuis]ATO70703.1 MCE family protein [Mycobacterium avium subsp. hominissuis]ATQ40732.1 MCE family protein [Mycobacterium avium subsp. hominissuis]PBJ41757.1 mammalian cell entry protein [Mycobacterium avium subsp. hominissuis]PBJ67703.1 mammalian cell entry protein [Mycobacterium avium subsp. hominissuis]